MIIKEKLGGKNIIFFSVQTFNLEKEIIKKLEEFGANVDYYDERPSNNNFVKGIIRLKRSVYQYRIDTYYKKILLQTNNSTYHYLFINRGEVVPEFFLKAFKKTHPDCKFIFYTWDSFKNQGHPTKILKYFDKKFTFDPDDAINFKLNFRPLFYLDSFSEIKKTTDNKIKYDLLFLGTAHSDRYRITNIVVNWCNDNGLTSFYYYFIHGRLVYFYKNIFDKSFQLFDYKKLSFKSLTTNQILELYKSSNVILDINHPGQKGLTMRTFEAIGAGKKIITTNSEIKRYSFYNEKNIYLIDRNDIVLDKNFFDSVYENISEELYGKLSIEGWLHCLFVERESDLWINGINASIRMEVAVTGASGFVGTNLKNYLESSYDVESLIVRYKPNQQFDLKTDAIIHLAGKAHNLKKDSNHSDYYEANFELAKQLFDSFLKSEASVFVFMSTVKAVADEVEEVLTEDAVPKPKTHYGISKLQAEQYILSQELPIGKRVYILRPSMIHGPANKGNLNLLYQLVSIGLPWPLGAFENQRSFLSIENLCFVIKELLENKEIPSGIYHLADDKPLSTNELIRLLGISLGRRSNIWKIPISWINVVSKFGGYLHLPLNSQRLQKLTENYVVSNQKIISAIGKPLPITSREGLLKTFQSFIK
ncbi:NAD-dependent epimerase/dehydratase family protein [Flavobacterium sp. WC2416]|uniref:NAD-dependent epimerase/dehydratase family protein n=1 Tax=Flavobacterium sp. WC2416 TaxID=3234141 RepID=A0AB39WAS3_9FLAO